MLDVAVIGGGPVGLASAAAILQNLGQDTTVQACSCLVPSATVACKYGQSIACLFGNFKHAVARAWHVHGTFMFTQAFSFAFSKFQAEYTLLCNFLMQVDCIITSKVDLGYTKRRACIEGKHARAMLCTGQWTNHSSACRSLTMSQS